jgi:spore maturation protein CgeB
MHLVVFGLSITSSWGNGHATLWRALVRALAERGHRTTFFERQVPWYAAHRDLESPDGATVVLYQEWSEARARQAIDDADAVIVTSYCPDARAAAALPGGGLRVFYDLDTPVTLDSLDLGREVPYLPEDGLGGFDLVLSFTGGDALRALRDRLGARQVFPLYGSVDVDAYAPGRRAPRFEAILSYLGTYASDRHAVLERLFLEAARRRPRDRFVLGGSQYPADFRPPANVAHVAHVAPREHPDFYASSAWTLNVTRGAMARLGYCPSGRLFEAAACGAAIASDTWPGLETFFAPGAEVAVVNGTDEVDAALALPEPARRRFGEAARHRVIREHTARHRAGELEALLRDTRGFAAVVDPRESVSSLSSRRSLL